LITRRGVPVDPEVKISTTLCGSIAGRAIVCGAARRAVPAQRAVAQDAMKQRPLLFQ